MMNRIIKGILFSFLLFSAGLINAQTDFRPGYVIEANGDTLYGEIDYRGDLLMSKVCRFKENDGKEIRFSPDDIVGYRFINNKYFVSKEVNGEKVFLEFLINGQLNIYFLKDEEGDHYFLEKKGIGLSRIPYEEGIRHKDGKNYFFTSTTHVGFLNVYMEDAPELQSRITEIKKPEHKNLIKLAEDYHYKICEDDAPCIIYEKTTLLNFSIEGSGGIINYPDFESKNLITGILFHVGMSNVNEKLSFRTGILYSTLKSGDEETAIYKIPIQIEYLYPGGLVQPKMSFGLNIYRPVFHSIAFMWGANIRLHKSISLGVNYEIDFYAKEQYEELNFFPDRILSHSISTGLRVRL